jgi:programmed cell death protein 5
MSDDLETLRQKRLRDAMQQQTQQQMQQQAQEEQIASQIKGIINQILTPEARNRLGNIRLARPEFARQVEILLIQLYQAGQLPQKLTDEKLKEILTRIHGKKKDIKITTR